MLWRSKTTHDLLVRYSEFIEDVYEIAFGDDAINREFTYDEVLTKLREFSDKALVSDEEQAGVEITQEEVDTLLTNKTGGMYNV